MQLTVNEDADREPEWCGNDVIFVRPDEDDPDKHRVFTMNQFGNNEREIICSGDSREPSCSPYNNWMAVGFDIGDGNRDIYRMTICPGIEGCCDGLGGLGNLTKLTVHPTTDNAPNWSPGGRHIAFSSLRDGDLEIYVIDAVVGEPLIERRTDNNNTDYSPNWDEIRDPSQ